MYLHLGQDTVVKLSEVVAIFDLENASIGKATKRYLALGQKQGLVVNVSTELPKSFVVCVDEKGKNTVYISQISSSTLKKRTNFVKEISI